MNKDKLTNVKSPSWNIPRVPLHLKEMATFAAKAEGISPAEFVRRAIAERVERAKRPLMKRP